jgi:cupin 2 domain-containing protein
VSVSASGIKNLFASLPARSPAEIVETLLKTEGFHLERIISAGQATPPGQWYDQSTPEWVVLLAGSAALRFEAEADLRVMQPGDYLHIPAHCRHRVEWTDAEQATVWLALHYRQEFLSKFAEDP